MRFGEMDWYYLKLIEIKESLNFTSKILIQFKWINQLVFCHKLPKKLLISDDFRENRSQLIHLNLYY